MKTLKVFLGGSTAKGNQWRESLKALNFRHLNLIDPYKTNYDAAVDIYTEIEDILTSDFVVFFLGGIGTEHEQRILKIVGKPKYKKFDDLKQLELFLSSLDKKIGG